MFRFLLMLCLAHASLCDDSKVTDFAVILPGDQDALGGMFVTPPICCPSREHYLTGPYADNHGSKNSSISDPYYASQSSHEKPTFASWFKEAGYNTFYAGKYKGCYPKFDSSAKTRKATHLGSAIATLMSS